MECYVTLKNDDKIIQFAATILVLEDILSEVSHKKRQS